MKEDRVRLYPGQGWRGCRVDLIFPKVLHRSEQR